MKPEANRASGGIPPLSVCTALNCQIIIQTPSVMFKHLYSLDLYHCNAALIPQTSDSEEVKAQLCKHSLTIDTYVGVGNYSLWRHSGQIDTWVWWCLCLLLFYHFLTVRNDSRSLGVSIRGCYMSIFLVQMITINTDLDYISIIKNQNKDTNKYTKQLTK